jgi:hypothetical protein
MSIIQNLADGERAQAKLLLNSALGFGGDTQSEAINMAVDKIISAALLEMAIIQRTAAKHISTSENP